MSVARTLALAAAPLLLGGLVACGSSSTSTPGASSTSTSDAIVQSTAIETCGINDAGAAFATVKLSASGPSAGIASVQVGFKGSDGIQDDQATGTGQISAGNLAVIKVVSTQRWVRSESPACAVLTADIGQTPSVHDAAVAFQNALINNDPAGACKYIDAAALKAQIAKSPQLKGKDCVALLTTVLAFAKASGQAVQPAKDITVLSENGDTATVRVTSAAGKAETSTWKLEGGIWKVVNTVNAQ